MSDVTLTPDDLMPRTRLDPQRLAWGVLLLAFTIFCIICIAAVIGVYYFLFQSTVPLSAALQVGRGTVAVGAAQQAVRGGQQNILPGDVLSTDSQTQAVLIFRDPQQAGRLVAAVTLKGDTSLTLRRALRPRFDWSTSVISFELDNLAGEVDVFIAQGLGHGLRLTIDTPAGVLADLSSAGQYIITASDAGVTVINRDGRVLLIAPDRAYGRDIPVDAQGTILATNPTEVIVSPAFVNLLKNSTFQDTLPVVDDTGQIQQITQDWACSNTQQDLPRGVYQPEWKDGRITLHLVRGDNAISNGETRCLAYFGQTGLDVSGYTFLALRTTFIVQYQSLALCGTQGSECPFMIRMDYVDEFGQEQKWFHGFYYAVDPQLNYPVSCNSCQQDHEKVNEKSWYTYDSGNLLALFPPGRRPRTIVNIQFYASGHQYDVYVGEVALLAGQASADLPADTSPAPTAGG